MKSAVVSRDRHSRIARRTLCQHTHGRAVLWKFRVWKCCHACNAQTPRAGMNNTCAEAHAVDAATAEWEAALRKKSGWLVRANFTFRLFGNDGWGVLLLLLLTSAITLACASHLGYATMCILLALIVVASDPIRVVYACSAPIAFFIRTSAFLDRFTYFPGHAELESAQAAAEIRGEVQALLARTDDGKALRFVRDTFNGANKAIAADVDDDTGRGWHLYVVKLGDVFTAHAQRDLPRLVARLQALPEVRSCVVSILDAHTRIPLHVGYFKGAMRYMFPIRVPSDRTACVLLLNGTTYHWSEGEGVLWDDCFPHLVRNDSDEVRVVLYMDVRRPLSSGWIHAPLRVLQTAGKLLLEQSGARADAT